MAAGCMDPSAVNYDPSATSSNQTCIYTDKVGDTCYGFEDVPEESLEDKSFTLSYAIDGDNWVFFHDYIPDFYFSTREKLHLVKDNKIYKANSGAPGKYFGGETTKSFFIDIVFKPEVESVLNSLNWVTEVIDRQTGINEEFSTLTHISIWNSWQTTGRVALSSVFETLETTNSAKSKSTWNFNDFRDAVAERGTTFLGNIFSNFAIDPDALDPNLPWYEQKLMEDEYFIVRFEFDNSADKVVILHDINADVTKSYR